MQRVKFALLHVVNASENDLVLKKSRHCLITARAALESFRETETVSLSCSSVGKACPGLMCFCERRKRAVGDVFSTKGFVGSQSCARSVKNDATSYCLSFEKPLLSYRIDEFSVFCLGNRNRLPIGFIFDCSDRNAETVFGKTAKTCFEFSGGNDSKRGSWFS